MRFPGSVATCGRGVTESHTCVLVVPCGDLKISHKIQIPVFSERSEYLAIQSLIPPSKWPHLLHCLHYLSGHCEYLSLQFLISDLGPVYFFKSNWKTILILTSDMADWHRMGSEQGPNRPLCRWPPPLHPYITGPSHTGLQATPISRLCTCHFLSLECSSPDISRGPSLLQRVLRGCLLGEHLLDFPPQTHPHLTFYVLYIFRCLFLIFPHFSAFPRGSRFWLFLYCTVFPVSGVLPCAQLVLNTYFGMNE